MCCESQNRSTRVLPNNSLNARRAKIVILLLFWVFFHQMWIITNPWLNVIHRFVDSASQFI